MTVMQIQCLLTYLGYSPGAIDGADGKNTQAAIRAFQADYGLTVDGIPGAATQKMLIGAIAGTAVKVEKPERSDAPKTGTFWDDIRYFTREELVPVRREILQRFPRRTRRGNRPHGG